MPRSSIIKIIIMIILLITIMGCLDYEKEYRELRENIQFLQTVKKNVYGEKEDNLLKNADEYIGKANMSDDDKLICMDIARSYIFDRERKYPELNFTNTEEDQKCKVILDIISKDR